MKRLNRIPVFILLLVFCIIIGGCEKTLVIIDEVQNITDDQWMTYDFVLEMKATVILYLSVKQGGSVTAYLMNETDYEKFLKWKKNLSFLRSRKFNHYESFAAVNKRSHQTFGELEEGRYILIIKEASNPNILGGSDTSLVSIKLSAEYDLFKWLRKEIDKKIEQIKSKIRT
ncbi:MAG: hypothetical protein IH946_07640 [Bacteroidetes bacterium]|nr:hypothetical protein [Bacteroidota bacterium]